MSTSKILRNAVFVILRGNYAPGMWNAQLSAVGNLSPENLTYDLHEWVYSCLISEGNSPWRNEPTTKPRFGLESFELEPEEGTVYHIVKVGILRPQLEGEKRLFFAERNGRIIYFPEEDRQATIEAITNNLLSY